MFEFMNGVAEQVLADEGHELAFEVSGGSIITTVRSNGRDAQNTTPLRRATSRPQGNAVGANLLAAL